MKWLGIHTLLGLILLAPLSYGQTNAPADSTSANHKKFDVLTVPWRVMKESNLDLGSPIGPENLVSYTRIMRSPFDPACLVAEFEKAPRRPVDYHSLLTEVVRNEKEQQVDKATALSGSGSYGMAKVSYESNRKHFHSTNNGSAYAYLYDVYEVSRVKPDLAVFSRCLTDEVKAMSNRAEEYLRPESANIQALLAAKSEFRNAFGTGFIVESTRGGIVELTSTHHAFVDIDRSTARDAMAASYHGSSSSWSKDEEKKVRLSEVRSSTSFQVFGGTPTLMNAALDAQFKMNQDGAFDSGMSAALTNWQTSIDETSARAIRGWAVPYDVLPELVNLAIPADVDITGDLENLPSFPRFSGSTIEPWVGSVLRLQGPDSDSLHWANALLPRELVTEVTDGIARYFVSFTVDPAAWSMDSDPVGFAYEELKQRLLPGGQHNHLFAPQYYSSLPEKAKIRVYPDLRVVIQRTHGGQILREQHVLRSSTFPAKLADVANTVLNTKASDTVRFEYSKSDYAIIKDALNDGTLHFRTVFVGEAFDEAPTPPMALMRDGVSVALRYDLSQDSLAALGCATGPDECWTGRLGAYNAFTSNGPGLSNRTIYPARRPIWTAAYAGGGAVGWALFCAPSKAKQINAYPQTKDSMRNAWSARVAPRKVVGELQEALGGAFCRFPPYCDSAGEFCRDVSPTTKACVVDADLYAWQERRGIHGLDHCN